jgi:hypothetical protein
MNSFNSVRVRSEFKRMADDPTRFERKTDPEPTVVPRLVVSFYGGGPYNLARLIREGGRRSSRAPALGWPKPVPFRLGQQPPRVHLGHPRSSSGSGARSRNTGIRAGRSLCG